MATVAPKAQSLVVFARVLRNAELALEPLEWLRIQWLGLLGPRLALLHRDRALRIVIFASTSILLAFALTLSVPLLVFSLSPLILGIPHLVADVRYLVLKPKLHQQRLRLCAIALPLVALVVFPLPELGVLAAFFAVIASSATWTRKFLVAGAVLLLAWLAHVYPYAAALSVTHGHHLVAIVFAFVLLRPARARARRWHWHWLWLCPLVLYAAGSWAVLSGICDGWLTLAMTRTWGLLDSQVIASWYSPRETEPLVAKRLLAWFVFSQSVHYACWLRMIPEAMREREATRGFRSSLRALVREFTGPGFFLMALACVVPPVYAIAVDVERARRNYLNVAVFHGYLELALIALWLCDPGLRARLRAQSATAQRGA